MSMAEQILKGFRPLMQLIPGPFISFLKLNTVMGFLTTLQEKGGTSSLNEGIAKLGELSKAVSNPIKINKTHVNPSNLGIPENKCPEKLKENTSEKLHELD